MQINDALDGTVALVTGASSGIGAATARALALLGASVGLVARRENLIGQLAAEIGSNGAQAVPIPADVTDEAQAASAVDSVVSRFGRLDIVVNNAGVGLAGQVVETPADEWQRVLAVNVQGLFCVTQAALPHLLASALDGRRGVADLVNISSIGGRIPRPNAAFYSASKAGVNAFCEALRQEVSQQNVRVSVVEPGTVATDLTSRSPAPGRTPSPYRKEKMERLRPEDVSDAVCYIVTRDRRVAVNEILVRASDQTW